MKVYVDHEIESYRWDSGLANYPELLKQNNIQLVSNLSEAELFCFVLDSRMMFDQLSETKQNNLLAFQGPIVILERVDAAICWFRDFNRLPNAYVFKNRIMRNPYLQNAVLYYGRYHYKLVYEACYDELKQNNITEQQQDLSQNWNYSALKPILNHSRVKSVLWDFHSSPLSKRMEPYKTNNNLSKQYDVFCVNRDKAGIQGFYRKKCRTIIESMNIRSLTKSIDKRVYPMMLKQSRVAVCSWGHGEWIHQDAYCMFSRVIIVKPRTDYVQMVPDLYTNTNIVFCEPDFSDLEDKIRYILEHYDQYQSMLENNYKLITSITRESATVQFAQELCNVFEDFSRN